MTDTNNYIYQLKIQYASRENNILKYDKLSSGLETSGAIVQIFAATVEGQERRGEFAGTRAP